jgi:hypothetical protein
LPRPPGIWADLTLGLLFLVAMVIMTLAMSYPRLAAALLWWLS